jgi:sialate O-acetylesterase
MKTGGPLEMTITGRDNALSIKDILVGEVWIGSGQSNMQWCVKDSNNGKDEAAAANYPSVRLFYVERKVATSPRYDCKGEWKVCTPETVPEFSAVLYFFGRDLHKELNLPVGLIHSSWGGTPAESWTSRPTLEADADLKVIPARWDDKIANYPKAKAEYDAAMKSWKEAAEQAKAAGQPEPKKPGAPQGADSPWLASGLYNAMIAPLVPYAVQGAVWYQGESNAGRAFQYRKLFAAMIKDWRKAWGTKDFSFYFVQLANFTQTKPDPDESDWAELREAQTMALKLKKTGMAVAIDIGEAKDIHPKNKQEVGRRLALNALEKNYGRDIAFSGPMYKSMSVKGGEIVVKFTHAGDELVAKGGDALKGFAIAGADKKFVWADAKIKGKTVVVSSPGVDKPVAVRYAWANNPVCNLYNGAGLPASPFRTDTWPGLTVNEK